MRNLLLDSDKDRALAADVIETGKGFRKLKAQKQLSVLCAAFQVPHDRVTIKPVVRVTGGA